MTRDVAGDATPAARPGTAPEAIVMGRLHADLYPLQSNTRLEDVRTFERFLGGFAGNVGVGAARLGVRTAVISAVGDDGHGRFIRATLAREGVDTTHVGVHPTLRTALTFAEIWPPDRFPLLPYRLPTCPDWELRAEELPQGWLDAAPLLIVSGTGLAQEPSRSATLEAMRLHRGGRGHLATVIDLDWRDGYWSHPDEYPVQVRRALELADVVIGSDSEFAVAGVDPEEVLELGTSQVYVKHGPDGASLLTAAGRIEAQPRPVTVVNGLGAGDAFAATILWGSMRNIEPAQLLQLASNAGAIVAGRLACSTAMPYEAELLSTIQAP
jgi:5-dehydro-2-deoxygluconokinase